MNTTVVILTCLLGISVVTNILLANLCMTRQKYVDLFKTLYKAWVDIADSKQYRIDNLTEDLNALLDDDKPVKVEN